MYAYNIMLRSIIRIYAKLLIIIFAVIVRLEGREELMTTYIFRSPEWELVTKNDRTRLELVFEEDGEFWSVADICLI